MIDELTAALRVNTCTVTGPLPVDDARAAIVARCAPHSVVACNADIPIPGLADALVERGIEVLRAGDLEWSARLVGADAGITGALLGVVEPAAIALVAAPGSPRATSLVPPEHICVLRVVDLIPTLADAMQLIAAHDLPSALTWIGGPSRTADLEMITTFGVHGPRAVEVVLLA